VRKALGVKDVQLSARELTAPGVRDVRYGRGRVTAPSLALDTSEAYLAKTPAV
jgi:hypothetical protein